MKEESYSSQTRDKACWGCPLDPAASNGCSEFSTGTFSFSPSGVADSSKSSINKQTKAEVGCAYPFHSQDLKANSPNW